jgi:DNA-binding XRE family transcriptional regulator
MNKFKQNRINAGLTRKEAAEKLGISIFHLRNIENDQKSPSKQVALKMSDLYSCSVRELITA